MTHVGTRYTDKTAGAPLEGVINWLLTLVVVLASLPSMSGPIWSNRDVSYLQVALSGAAPLWLTVALLQGVPLRTPGAPAVLLYLAFSFLSYALNGVTASAWVELARLTQAAVLFLMAATGFEKEPPGQPALWGLFMTGGWMGLDVLAWELHSVSLGEWSFERANIVMVPTTVGEVVSVVLILVVAREAGRSWTRLWVALFALFLSAVLVLTFSRAAYLAAAMGLLVLASRRRQWPVAALGWIFLALTAVTILRPEVIGRAADSDPGRVVAWTAALGVLGNSPWLGIGQGRFAYDSLTFAPSLQPLSYMSAHNHYLLVAAQTGLLGLFSFLALLWTLTAPLMRYSSACVDAGGCLGAMVAFMVHGLFHDDSVWYPAAVMFSWSLLGYCSGTIKRLQIAPVVSNTAAGSEEQVDRTS